MTHRPLAVAYVTKNRFKIEENEIVRDHVRLADGSLVGDVFEFRIQKLDLKEDLEIDLDTLVRAEAIKAYYILRVPCVVEHAGLIFKDKSIVGYPGGLTKPMWDSLGDDFITETHSAGREAIARAVVGYCDGMRVRTFSGDTPGFIANEPRGDRKFYWDTVFVPSTEEDGMTYAEIVEHPSLGLPRKVELSQSTKAMTAFLEWRRNNKPELWL